MNSAMTTVNRGTNSHKGAFINRNHINYKVADKWTKHTYLHNTY